MFSIFREQRTIVETMVQRRVFESNHTLGYRKIKGDRSAVGKSYFLMYNVGLNEINAFIEDRISE